ncbi:MAG: FKBP-type peptidyl-prolyl cis-trans isomerase [Pseudomonadota bacterium]
MSENDSIQTDADKVSYGLGLQLGNQIVEQSFNGFNLDALIVGIKDIFNNKPCRFEDDVMQNAFSEINKMVSSQKNKSGDKNQTEGQEFLVANAKKEGILSTASGMQYEIMVEGNGPIPTASDTVTTHYHGSLINGSVFDSSVNRGQPAEFPVNGVIKGWTEALQMMEVGSKWRLFIPPELAYGEQGAGADIGPNTTLIFEVELLAIS